MNQTHSYLMPPMLSIIITNRTEILISLAVFEELPLTKNNPSYGKCLYAAPGSVGSAVPPFSKYKSSFL
ncbi:hypothetical protein DITRI_Ditri08aG0075600 [Diplodiscus trichospermus]